MVDNNPVIGLTNPSWPSGISTVLPDSKGGGSGMAAVTVPVPDPGEKLVPTPKNPETTWSAGK